MVGSIRENCFKNMRFSSFYFIFWYHNFYFLNPQTTCRDPFLNHIPLSKRCNSVKIRLPLSL
jgi:hypothetical protein